MIQLTKGTNVLDINLSDFSGAGQDVVQNGSFDDIGSDLVQNGDFAEIGSELVTNGDFSEEGSNLITNPNFTNTGSELLSEGASPMTGLWGSNGSIIDGKLVKTALGIAYQTITYTEGKSYKAIVDVESLDGNTTFWLAGTNSAPLVVGINTIYIVAGATAGFGAAINDGFSSGEGSVIKSISVKELGEDWTLGTGWNIGDDKAVFTGTSDAAIYQADVTTVNKYYKVSVEVLANEGTAANTIFLGTNEINSTNLSVGVHTFYGQALANTILYIYGRANDELSITNVSVQELGEGWTLGPDWSISNGKLNGINVTNTSPGTDTTQTGITFALKSFKVVYTISNYSQGEVNILLGGYKATPNRSSNGTFTEYITIDIANTILYIQGENSFTGSISDISIKEVGQDWTVQEPDGQSVTFPNSTLSIIYDSTETQGSTGVYQDILTIGKYYKIEIDVASITGDLKLQVGSDSQVINTTGTSYFYTKSDSARIYIVRAQNADSVSAVVNSISIKQLDTNNRWVTFADPDSKSVMKLGQVDLEIDSSGNNCGVYQTGLIKPNKLYIITINMKATAAINVEIAASLGTAVSAVIGTETLTTSYKEYSFEYVTPFAVDHDLQIHRLLGSGASQTISIDYVSMNGVDESQWTNDPTWDPFATSLVFVPTLTDESTNNSKQFTLNTSITDGGWDGRSLHGQVIINEFPTEVPASGIINLKQPDFLEGFYQVEIRGYLGTFYRVLGKCMAHLERASTEDGYNRFESYNDTVTYKAYEE